MAVNFINLVSIEQLDELLAASFRRPIFLFKHSDTCGISLDMHDQLQHVNGDAYVITVQSGRHISNAVVERLGIRHASPQAFVVSNGEVVYHATHYGIDPQTIDGYLKSDIK